MTAVDRSQPGVQRQHDAATVAVYDRYWPTGGGGEKFAAGIAAAAAGDHRVALLAHEPFDMGWLGERLQVDLAGVDVEVLPAHPSAMSRASARYDLLVNASYGSGDVNRARRGLYVVHFPGPAPTLVERVRRRVARRGGRLLATPGASVDLAEGFYLAETTRLHAIRWTSGDAELVVRSPARGPVPVVVLLGRFLPAGVAPLEVRAEVNGRTLGSATVDAPASHVDRRRSVALAFDVEVPTGGEVRVDLRCPTWQPSEHGVGTDRRPLGVPVIGARIDGGWRGRLARAAPLLAGPDASVEFLASYDRVVANSRYTQGWVERMWHHPSDVLYPPVTAMARGAKDPLILSVGRFFLPGTGHNKKQLEMVEAFRQLHGRGVAEGWEYHLVGGCSPEDAAYLDEIRAAARGLPVVVHPDASGAELRALYGRASIFWHAAGLGEHPERHPDRYEHFGITTVEAMSAGAVPVVIDAAGQVEIVEQGVSGYRFATLTGLVAHTERLIAEPAWRGQLSLTAERRARAFGWDAFVERVNDEVTALIG